MRVPGRAGRASLEAAALVLAKCLLSYLVLRAGFTHVSDDDYSRTVIAEQFAHAPRLDPSGTSWLPFPFWIHGTSMLVFGRSLATARATAFVVSVLGTLLFYGALRSRGPKEGAPEAAVLALAGFALPWMAWLSVATVPEAMCAALACAGIVGLSRRTPLDRADVGWAACILFASLCRYEAWAFAAVAAVVVAMRARAHAPESRRWLAPVMLLAIAGPLAWLLWNAYAHHDALHFLARVAKFRKKSGQGGGSLADNLLFYPRALLVDQKEILLVLALAISGVVTRKAVRDVFWVPMIACGAVALFLLAGAVSDGAPTHHPARALSITYPILVATALAHVWDRARAATHLRNAWAATLVCGAVLCGVPWLFAERPGASAAEDRAPRIAQGLALRAQAPVRVELTPCVNRYDHFALIAAFGAPERVTVNEPRATDPGASCELQVDVSAPH